MKYCARCERSLSRVTFTVHRGRSDGLQVYCRDCMKKSRLKSHRRDKSVQRKRNQNVKDRIRDIVRQAKAVPCADCDHQYPFYVMQFDHLEDKSFNISQAPSRGSMKGLLEEINKCEVVCANCHAERTFGRGREKHLTATADCGTI